jgi:hypothetical protein
MQFHKEALQEVVRAISHSTVAAAVEAERLNHGEHGEGQERKRARTRHEQGKRTANVPSGLLASSFLRVLRGSIFRFSALPMPNFAKFRKSP